MQNISHQYSRVQEVTSLFPGHIQLAANSFQKAKANCDLRIHESVGGFKDRMSKLK